MLNRHLNTICRCDCENRWIVCSSSCNSAAITKFNYFCQKRRQPAAPQHTLTLRGEGKLLNGFYTGIDYITPILKCNAYFFEAKWENQQYLPSPAFWRYQHVFCSQLVVTYTYLFPYLHQISRYLHQISTHLVSVAGGCASECRRPRPQVDWTGGGSVQPAPAWPLLLVPVVTGQQQFLLLVASSAEQRAEYLAATPRHPPHTASL